MSNYYNIAIIGSGPAASTAGLYLGMSGQESIIMFSGEVPGGQLTTTNIVDNYPGIQDISGIELSDKFMDHSKKYVPIVFETIISIEKKNNIFILTTQNNIVYSCKYLIIASGSCPKKLDIAKAFENKGVSYCHICDGFLFKGENVIVVGGGNSAFEAEIYLSNICKKVYLIHRNDKFKAFKELQQKAFNTSNIEILINSEITDIKSNDEKIEYIQVTNNDVGAVLNVSGIFIAIGHNPNTYFIKDIVKKNSSGYILVNRLNQCLDERIFAVGDCCVYEDGGKKFLQAVVAAAEGCNAALHLIDLINKE